MNAPVVFEPADPPQLRTRRRRATLPRDGVGRDLLVALLMAAAFAAGYRIGRTPPADVSQAISYGPPLALRPQAETPAPAGESWSLSHANPWTAGLLCGVLLLVWAPVLYLAREREGFREFVETAGRGAAVKGLAALAVALLAVTAVVAAMIYRELWPYG